jgi:Holliday junction resolvasome RuvABC endonuclease subunit
MRILALDIASVTGVAVGESHGSVSPRAWSVDLGKAKSEDHRFSQALILTHKLIAEHKPDLIAVEAAVGGPKTSHFLVGLLACIRGCAANRGVPIKTYPINSIRKHFTGRALQVRDFPGLNPSAAKKQIKAVVMQRCRMLGWDFTDDNAADALALLDFARATEGAQTIPAGGLFR